MSKLTGGRLLARNTVYNLLGQGLPMLVALAAIPLLIQGLGTDRFGVLTLAWILIGYFSLFDLGLGRALTQMIAERLGAGRQGDVAEIARAGLSLMFLLGVVGSVVLLLITPWLVGSVLTIPAPLQRETAASFYLLAFSLPLVISTAGLRGILEAQQRFGLVNALRVPLGVFTFLGPLLVLPFTSSLAAIVASLVVVRGVSWIAHLLLCLDSLRRTRPRTRLDLAIAWPLLRFGGWMTVTNVVSPLMTYLDRFLIGATLSIAAVAYYVTPYEVVTKLWIIPGAVLGVVFPAIASSFLRDRNRSALLFDRAFKFVFLAIFPFVLLAVPLAREGLGIWLGEEFAENSARVLQWLAVGVLVNSVAQVPFTVLQAAGRPDLTAKLHLIELPVYLLAIGWLITWFGVEGAAIAWVARVLVDLVALLFLTQRILPESGPATYRIVWTLALALSTVAAITLPDSLPARMLLLLLTFAALVPAAWYLFLSSAERALIVRRRGVAGAASSG